MSHQYSCKLCRKVNKLIFKNKLEIYAPCQKKNYGICDMALQQTNSIRTVNQKQLSLNKTRHVSFLSILHKFTTIISGILRLTLAWG